MFIDGKRSNFDFRREDLVDLVENRLEYVFLNKSILQNIIEDSTNKANQRLEFLGDSIISFIITEYIFMHHARKSSGFLSQLRSYLISNEIQVKICHMFGLYDILHWLNNRSKNRSNVKIVEEYDNKSISNFLETLIGGVYLDCKDMKVIERLVKRLWYKFFNTYDKDLFNAKSIIQEYCVNNNLEVPVYFVKKNIDNVYTMGLRVGNRIVFASARNKKNGEKLAAGKMVKLLKIKGLK